MTEQKRIVELVLYQVGMEGSRTVRIGPVIASGAHSYRHVTVDGHRPLVCRAVVADLLRGWLVEHAGKEAQFGPFSYRISTWRDDGLDLIVEVAPMGPV